MSKPITIAAAGDIFANDRFFQSEKPISDSFVDVLALVREADAAFANYEMPLTVRGHPIEKLANIRAHPEIAEDIGKIGLTVASVANNHMMDYGPEGLIDTLSNLRDQGVVVVGAGETLDEAVAPVVLEIEGKTLGFLAFSCLVAPGAGATADAPGIAALHVHSSYGVNPYWQAEEPGEPAMITITTTADPAEQEFAEEQVRRLRKQVDFLCLSLHWGYGGLSSRIATYQRPLAHSMIEAGADVIFGNHVHAVQGVEKYQGKLIFYSPGTFIGRQLPPESEGGEITDLVRSLLADMSPDGYLALIDIDSDGDYIGRMVPTSLDARGLPVVAAGADFDRIASRIVDWSSQLGTAVTRSNGGLAVG